jgi:hypothetical protein
MNHARLLLAATGVLAMLATLLASVHAADTAAAPPARQVPGINAADKHPNGCVDCHVVHKDKGLDARLSVVLKEWTAGKVDPALLAQTKATMPAGVVAKGKHPSADDALEDIPAACLDCHDSASKKAPPFSRLLHLVHLTGGGKNPYMTVYQGECTHCHKLDAKTGAWSLPSGPEK